MYNSKELYSFHLSSATEKKKETSGLKIAKAIEAMYRSGYYDRRNAKFKKNRLFSRGKQPMQEFLDWLNVDGKNAFTNIDMKAPAIAPKFIQVIINGFLKRTEKPKATAVDPVSVARKKYDKAEAEFMLTDGDNVRQYEELTGMKKVADKQFTPEDYEDLEIFFGLHYKQTEEILFENGISYVLNENGWDGNKRKILEDLVEVGMAASKTTAGYDGKITVRRITPENLVYGFSDYDDFAVIPCSGFRCCHTHFHQVF